MKSKGIVRKVDEVGRVVLPIVLIRLNVTNLYYSIYSELRGTPYGSTHPTEITGSAMYLRFLEL